MKSLGLLILLCAAAFFLYPLAMQRTTSECMALRRETLPGSLSRPSGDPPDWSLRGWPKPAGCAWLYWRRMSGASG